MIDQTCANCRYFTTKLSVHSTVRHIEGVGECRRNAPRGPVSLGWRHGDPKDGETHIAILSSFPPVPFDDWCADFAFSEAVMLKFEEEKLAMQLAAKGTP